MSGSRDQIFGALRRSLKVSGEDEGRRAAVEQRLGGHERILIPERSQGEAAKLAALFKEKAGAVQTSVAEVVSLEDVPEAVADFLREHNQPARVKVSPSADLKALDWQGSTLLEAAFGKAEESDPVSVTRALAGVAETGTLALVSGEEHSTTLNFLPETNVVVLRRSEIVGPYEDVWDRLRERFGEGVMPRTVNFITGPSRTGDIEQKILLGAHGPKRLHVILVGDDGPEGHA
ncbi:LutC/YkgG family protein [Limibacillus halophilus]|jgi:L-lactate dehydrogenase complex protein LldG